MFAESKIDKWTDSVIAEIKKDFKTSKFIDLRYVKPALITSGLILRLLKELDEEGINVNKLDWKATYDFQLNNIKYWVENFRRKPIKEYKPTHIEPWVLETIDQEIRNLPQNNKSVGDYLTILDVQLRKAKEQFALGSEEEAKFEIQKIAAITLNILNEHGLSEKK